MKGMSQYGRVTTFTEACHKLYSYTKPCCTELEPRSFFFELILLEQLSRRRAKRQASGEGGEPKDKQAVREGESTGFVSEDTNAIRCQGQSMHLISIFDANLEVIETIKGKLEQLL